jgi:hypothetical protein
VWDLCARRARPGLALERGAAAHLADTLKVDVKRACVCAAAQAPLGSLAAPGTPRLRLAPGPTIAQG